jgi:excisionase family DNA binding protein
MTKNETLLKVADVAQLLQLNEKTVYALASNGVIPSIRIGGAIRFSLEEVWQAIHASGSSEPVASGASEARS